MQRTSQVVLLGTRLSAEANDVKTSRVDLLEIELIVVCCFELIEEHRYLLPIGDRDGVE